MQLTASKPADYSWSVCRRKRILRGMRSGLAAADDVCAFPLSHRYPARLPSTRRFPKSPCSCVSLGLMRALVGATICALFGRADAAASEIHMPGAASSKLHRQLVLIPVAAAPAHEYTCKVVIRDTRSNAEVASDPLIAYGRVAGREPYMRAAWSTDSRYVAFNMQWTRHTRETLVYQVTASGMTRIQLPEYWRDAQRALGKAAEFVGGTETPIRWLDHRTLLIRSFGTLRDGSGFDLLLTAVFRGSTASVRSITLNKRPNQATQ